MPRRRRFRPKRPRDEAPVTEGAAEGAPAPTLRDRLTPKRLLMLAGALAFAVAGPVVALVLVLAGGDDGPDQLRAIIIDQLGLTSPNEEFVDGAALRLLNAGYEVEYAEGDVVTVDFYRELGRHDFDLVVLRSHVARLGDRATNQLGDDAILFTSEPYDETLYLDDQRAGHLAFAHTYAGGDLYFGVIAPFILEAAKGDFDGATLILMGCDGLRSEAMARAFVERGAEAVVAWDAPVTAGHTDEATAVLLEHYVTDGLPLEGAVALTMEEIGPDPAYDASLRVFTGAAESLSDAAP